MYRCPEAVNYDISVSGQHLTVVALTDTAECTLHGTSAHCLVTGPSLSHGDVYDMPVKFDRGQVTVNSTVCKADH